MIGRPLKVSANRRAVLGQSPVRFSIGSTAALLLGMNDKDGRMRISLGVEPDGSPSFDLRGKKGMRRFILFVKGDDRPELALFDTGQKRRVGLVIDSQPSSINSEGFTSNGTGRQ